MPRPRAFSLIELLVVIGIVAALVGILLPTLGLARDTARTAVCLSQQRQMLVAIHAYSSDEAGAIPYGKIADAPSPSNFYPVTGMVTSLIARPPGEPIGLGLLLDHYLQEQPRVVFCPGTDQPLDAEAELALVDSDWALSNYYYRHGSNTQDSLFLPYDQRDDHIRLADLGSNSQGEPIRALVIDQNFLSQNTDSAYKVLNTRTNHGRQVVNTGFADGHARGLSNPDDALTVQVGFNFSEADQFILDIFERADLE